MRKFIKILPWIAVMAVLSGCGTTVMMTLPSQEIRPAPATKANVVFMRTSFVAGAINADLFEVVDGRLKFIGVLPMGKKIVYETTPGPKVFMAYGTAADFMLANLSGGKTYYSIVRPNWGSGGMIPTPIRADGTSEFNMQSADFAKWVADTTLIGPNAEAQDWFNKEKDRYQKIYEPYWATFQKKTAAQKMERTLRPQDGVSK
ncbi:MAG: hypothetical protein HY308_04425 [Gammaproteobacteria bacterium]|nr:hypothetical protein [Gammaproteobacteria bacterium]